MKPFGEAAALAIRIGHDDVDGPGQCAAVTAVIEVALTTITLVAATPPIVTVAPVVKPVPVSVTAVPPAAGPTLGLIAVTVGARDKREAVREAAALAIQLVTTTSTAPGACAAVTAVIEVALTTIDIGRRDAADRDGRAGGEAGAGERHRRAAGRRATRA